MKRAKVHENCESNFFSAEQSVKLAFLDIKAYPIQCNEKKKFDCFLSIIRTTTILINL